MSEEKNWHERLLEESDELGKKGTHTICFASHILGSHLATGNQLEFCYRVCTQSSLYKSYQHNRPGTKGVAK
jgi:hypothetical protein